MDELYKRYRPKTFKAIIGQDAAVDKLTNLLRKGSFPHTVLFTGPSGCGKTTLARILKTKLKCADQDFKEINCADFRGIDMVREIRDRMKLSPIGGGESRIWLIDEAHQLSAAAQDAFLKYLEDTPSWVYFLLATTDPGKLKATLKNRSTVIALKQVSTKDISELVRRIIEKEEEELSEEVFDKLVNFSEGSPRQALVLLHQVLGMEDEEKQLAAISKPSEERQAIEIARSLLNPKIKWPAMAKVLKEVDEDPEKLRWMVLAYATNVLLGGGKLSDRCYLILEAFSDNYFDTKKAGLIRSCYEVIARGTAFE